MEQREDRGERDPDNAQRRRSLATIPRRTVSRVLVLVAALLGILYLRERTSAIAGCMSDAFRAPAPAGAAREPARVRLKVGGLDASAQNP
ncbi:MAG: hypothetical protein ABSB49_07585 [Polyangia bacterium]|jgi:hypothetical protein